MNDMNDIMKIIFLSFLLGMKTVFCFIGVLFLNSPIVRGNSSYPAGPEDFSFEASFNTACTYWFTNLENAKYWVAQIQHRYGIKITWELAKEALRKCCSKEKGLICTREQLIAAAKLPQPPGSCASTIRFGFVILIFFFLI